MAEMLLEIEKMRKKFGAEVEMEREERTKMQKRLRDVEKLKEEKGSKIAKLEKEIEKLKAEKHPAPRRTVEQEAAPP